MFIYSIVHLLLSRINDIKDQTMFVLVEMKDTVRIPPWLFNVKFNDAIVEALNKKFANKVSTVKFV